MKHFLLTIFILTLIPCHNRAQDSNDSTHIKEKDDRPLYLESGIGSAISTYRDFATSPLIYYGSLLSIPVTLRSMDEKREIEFTFRNSIGAYDIFFGDELTMSTGFVNNLRYTHLFQIKKWSAGRLNVKLGGTFDLATIFRLNPSLLNNATGYELIGSLHASGKLLVDLSRKEARTIDLLWVPFYFKPRRREINFQLDIGLVNANYRNGYAYIGQELILNNIIIFDGYELSVFTGYRFGSKLDFTYYLLNRNAIRFAYIWDAYTTGGDLPRFEMSHHILEFALLYNLK